MSGVEALATVPETPVEVIPDFETDMGAIWDKMVTQNGADRGDDGRFTSPNNDNPDEDEVVPETESVLEGADAGEVTEPDSSTPSVQSVPLPPNWRGKEELWGKIPADIQSQLAEFQNEQHKQLSDQGRQLAASKPINDVVSEFKHLFEGRYDENGQPFTAEAGIRRLAQAQEMLENPNTRLQTAFNIIQGYPGLLDQMVAVLSGQAQMPVSQPQPRQRNIDAEIDAKVTEKLDLRSREQAVADFATANPLWAQLSDDQQINYTRAARTLLPNAAPNAVLKKALAMAIEDTPALKQQVTPAAPKPPVVTRSVSPEAVKRANSVNVTSTSTGKVAQPTLDQELDAIWDKHRKG